ncbi:MAG: ABC transporter substrate-binding protein [Stomatobaculum sp.]|nr:ABC transporter substrate-binding protein [Stomatobaculum sp.]
MRKSFRQLGAVMLSLAMAASITACGGSSSTTTAAQGGTESSGAASSSAEETTANASHSESGDSARGVSGIDTFELGQPEGWTEKDATKKVVYMQTQAISTLDKWAVSQMDTAFTFDYLCFDGLLSKDADGNTIPWVAESYEMADDDSSITFKIRDGIYFTNGELLDVDDCIFTLERIRDDTEHLPDSVAKSWRNYIGEIERIDDKSFKMNFAKPMPEFWTMINTPDIQILPKDTYLAMDYDEFWARPVGTGPYVVTNFDGANSVIEMTIRTDEHGYFGYDLMDRYTNVKDIKIQRSPESTTRVSALRTGEADFVQNLNYADILPVYNEGFHTYQQDASTQSYLMLACAPDDIFANKDLREALSLCIDREALVEALQMGFAQVAYSPSERGDLGYDSNGPRYAYDVERAKELVKNSGYSGEEIKFIYSTSNSTAPESTQAIQSMAQEIGLNIKVSPLEKASFDEARSKHEYDMMIDSIGKSGNMWFKIFAEVIGDDRFNSGCTNTALMDLGKSMQTIMDSEKLDETFRQMNEILLTDFEPILCLSRGTPVHAWNAKLHGIEYHHHKIPDMRAMVYED